MRKIVSSAPGARPRGRGENPLPPPPPPPPPGTSRSRRCARRRAGPPPTSDQARHPPACDGPTHPAADRSGPSPSLMSPWLLLSSRRGFPYGRDTDPELIGDLGIGR